MLRELEGDQEVFPMIIPLAVKSYLKLHKNLQGIWLCRIGTGRPQFHRGWKGTIGHIQFIPPGTTPRCFTSSLCRTVSTKMFPWTCQWDNWGVIKTSKKIINQKKKKRVTFQCISVPYYREASKSGCQISIFPLPPGLPPSTPREYRDTASGLGIQGCNGHRSFFEPRSWSSVIDGGVVETRMGGKFRNFEEKKWKIHKNLKKWYFRTFSGLKVELPCQKKWFWTNDYMYCHSRNHPTFTPAVSRKPKEVHHRIEVWRTRTAGPSIQVLWRSRSLQLAGVITYRLHVLFKTSPCQTKKVSTRIPTKNQRRGHAPAKSMALPRTSASAKPPRERCRMDTNSRSNLSVETTPDTMTSWSVDDWTVAVAASTENRSQVPKIPNPVPKHNRSTAMWRLKISWTHTAKHSSTCTKEITIKMAHFL